MKRLSVPFPVVWVMLATCGGDDGSFECKMVTDDQYAELADIQKTTNASEVAHAACLATSLNVC